MNQSSDTNLANTADTASHDSNNQKPLSSNNARAVIINVDDLGLSNAVNDAVIHLAKRGRVGATSFMVGGTISDTDIHTLKDLGVDVGLHLDLTGVFPSLLRSTLKSLIVSSYSRRLNPAQVTKVIKQQLDKFEDKFAHAPIFVDGHQHIHQLPIIRQCLADELKARYGSQKTISARVTTPLVKDIKSQIIYKLGGQAWLKLCQDNHIATNDKFGGVYDFKASTQQLAALWDKWLQSAPRSSNLSPALYAQRFDIESQGTYAQYGSTTPPIHSVPLSLPNNLSTTLIMCHPAIKANDWQDEIKDAREREYEWLMSRQFEDLLQQHEVRLVRWSDESAN